MTGQMNTSAAAAAQRRGVGLRRAHVGDAAHLARLAGELGYPTGPEEMRRRLAIIADRADHAVFVAEWPREAGPEAGVAADEPAARIIGWIHVAREFLLESGEGAEILGLVVERDVRRTGAGRHLVAAAEQWSRSLGLERIIVRSNVVREESHRFYPALGFMFGKTQHLYGKPLV